MPIAQKLDYSWSAGMGDIPKNQNLRTGVGGLCPLVINGLKYGVSNLYSKSIPEAALHGEPKVAHRPFLTQRSSKTYKDLFDLSNNAGRTGFGVTASGDVIVVVKEHGKPASDFNSFRDIFIRMKCIHAVACDGSDSVFLWYNGKFIVTAAENKNETQTSGVGFRAGN